MTKWIEPYPRDPAVVAGETDGSTEFADWIGQSLAAHRAATPASEEPGDIFAALLAAQLNLTAEPTEPIEGTDQ